MNPIQLRIAELLAAKSKEVEPKRFLSDNFQPRISSSTHTEEYLNPRLLLLLRIVYRINLFDIELLRIITEWIDPPIKYPNIVPVKESFLLKTWPIMRIELITGIDRGIIWTHLISILIEVEKIKIDKTGGKS